MSTPLRKATFTLITAIVLSNSFVAGHANADDTQDNLLVNSDFKTLDSKGSPTGWRCACHEELAVCDNHTHTPAITLAPGCMLISSAILLQSHNQGVTFTANVNSANPHFADFSMVALSGKPNYQILETAHPIQSQNSQSGLALISSSVSSNGADYVGLRIRNTQAQPIIIQSLGVLQKAAQPLAKEGSILKAAHLTALTVSSHTDVKDIWTPLPLDYANQVPLSLKLTATPKEAVESIRYQKDSVGNWGAIVKLASKMKAKTVFHLKWESIVLSKRTNEDERSSVYQDGTSLDQWTHATEVVQADTPLIRDTALKATEGKLSALDKMLGVIGWTSTQINGKGEIKALDALSVFNTRNSSCTGFANLASAMGRAAGVPTRSMANIYVGMPQQTHYINEFYLGSELGWRRVEPQSSNASVPDDFGVMIRKILPEDEGAQANNHWAIPGVPFLSTTDSYTVPSASHIGTASGAELFPDCAECDNRAEHVVDLKTGHANMNSLFERAKALWSVDFQSYLDRGSISENHQAHREQANSIISTEDLDLFLKSLESQPPLK